jgi:hypothetical protein
MGYVHSRGSWMLRLLQHLRANLAQQQQQWQQYQQQQI